MNGVDAIVDERIERLNSVIAHQIRLELVGAEPCGQAALPSG
jgi:hypothetical protein